MSTSNLLVIAALVIAVAVYAYIYIGAKRLYAQREKRVAGQTATAPATGDRLPSAPDASPTAAPPLPVAMPAAASPFLAAPDGPADDLTQIKGIGPKLSARLTELGVFHFRQIAGWTPDQMAAVDAELGSFQGRPERDQWQAQARLLASGDRKAYERAHGKLSGTTPPAGLA